MQKQLEEETIRMGLNQYFHGKNEAIGIVACGIAYNYYMEIARSYNLDYPILKISHYPVPGPSRQ